MARFRSKEARLKELEDRKLWLNNPNKNWRNLNRKDFDEFIIYKAIGEVGKAFSEEMTADIWKEIDILDRAGKPEQAEKLFKRYVVDRQDKR
ncbi:MAG: hypothetical protein AB2697_21850 [Candidatus Thiodiazotropha endolucinida]